jgi:hypothetical protein
MRPVRRRDGLIQSLKAHFRRKRENPGLFAKVLNNIVYIYLAESVEFNY